MRRIPVALLSLTLLALLPAVAQAQPSWTVQSLNTIGCESSQTQFTTVVSGIAAFPTTLRFHTLVDADGLRYMDEDAGTPGSNGNYGWALYNSSSGGPTTATFPLPPNTPVTVTFQLIDGVAGPVVTEQIVTLTRCNGGTILGETVLAIPTLDRWGLIALVTALAFGGALLLRRRSAGRG